MKKPQIVRAEAEVDGRGVPLSLVVTGANRHDVTQLELVLEEIVIDRSADIQQNLCADKSIFSLSPTSLLGC